MEVRVLSWALFAGTSSASVLTPALDPARSGLDDLLPEALQLPGRVTRVDHQGRVGHELGVVDRAVVGEDQHRVVELDPLGLERDGTHLVGEAVEPVDLWNVGVMVVD